MSRLQSWAVGGLMIATVMVGMTGFLSQGLSVYGVSGNVNEDRFNKLKKVENATQIADKAQKRAEQAQAKSNFFTLPKIIKLLRLPFDSIPIWETFVATSINTLGLQYATGDWPLALFSGVIGISIAFAFARRVL